MLPVDWPPVENTSVSTHVRTIVVVADDLIWSSRLAAAAQRAGAASRVVGSVQALREAIGGPEGNPVIVDLAGRGYDGVDAVRQAAAAGAKVVAVGQHEDVPLRKAALAAGARRVYSYNKLFTDGPRVLAGLLESAP